MEIEGDLLLVRDVFESQANDEPSESKRPNKSMAEVMSLFDTHGVGDPARKLLEMGERLGLGQRIYRNCIMLTPANKKNVGLVTFGVWRGKPVVYCWRSGFTENYDLADTDVAAALGDSSERPLDDHSAAEVAAGLGKLLSLSTIS
jgi:hypothetical protein